MTEFEIIRYQVKKAKARFIGRLQGLVSSCPSGCIQWAGARNHAGYGLINFRDHTRGNKHVQLKAHRLFFILHSAEPIPVNMEVDHTCGNRCCVNPAHLQLVSGGRNKHYRYTRT